MRFTLIVNSSIIYVEVYSPGFYFGSVQNGEHHDAQIQYFRIVRELHKSRTRR